MQNQRTYSNAQRRQNDMDELYVRLGASHRLKAADKPIFARNLGDLAARISPDDALDGARRIVMHSGNESLWPTKRKKFFRLPDEDAPPPAKDGDYASYPAQFRKLAEAAGELLCRSSKPEDIENWKMMAIKDLAKGSSFMPSFVPAGLAGQSAKNLLDEYATVLAEAVKSRTKITELWEILQNTPIGLEVDQENSSPYGDAASFPRALLTPMYRDFVTTGYLTTSEPWIDDEWSKPCVKIGFASFPVRFRMFCIPADKRHLFPQKPKPHLQLSSEALEWLKSVGFDLEEKKFPDLDAGDQSHGWVDAYASIFLSVGLAISHNGDADPLVEIHLWGDLDYAAHPNREVLESNVAQMVSDPSANQYFCFNINNEYEQIAVVYDRPLRHSADQEAVAMGLVDPCWMLGPSALGGDNWATPSVWLDEASGETCDEIWQNNYTRGWTDEEFIMKLLMSEETEFHPIIPESDPVGGVLPSGSIGASLLQNARTASSGNRITQLLIDKAALTAETGLRFYEAVLHDYRSAIHRI